METTQPVARVQGGRRIPVTCIGRRGTKQILVAYSTKAGERRERWLSRDRVYITDEEIAALPAYAPRICPAADLPEPILADGNVSDRCKIYLSVITCPTCGRQHLARYKRVGEWPNHEVYYVGRKRLLLGYFPKKVK